MVSGPWRGSRVGISMYHVLLGQLQLPEVDKGFLPQLALPLLLG